MKRDRWKQCCMIIGLCLAIAIRSTLFGIHTPDYDADFSRWYDFIQSHGGFAALRYNFSNYNVSYLYLLTLATYIPLPKIVSIKLIPVCFDLMMAWFLYLIVKLKYEKSPLPTMALLVVLFTPTVVIMSGLWGQFESCYASLSVGSLYFVLRRQPFWACVFFGLAVSFKPQALFLFPVLFVLLITGKIPLRFFLTMPVAYLVTILPACLLGRGFIDVLTTYRSRADNGEHLLNLHAPNIFQWLPAGPFSFCDTAGFTFAFSAVVILICVIITSRRKITNNLVIKETFVFVIIVPFLLPEMHERYFYLADIISLIYAFYFPKYFYIPFIMQISSLASYIPYLRIYALVCFSFDLKYIALLVLGVVIITTLDLVKFTSSSELPAPWYGVLFWIYKDVSRKIPFLSSINMLEVTKR